VCTFICTNTQIPKYLLTHHFVTRRAAGSHKFFQQLQSKIFHLPHAYQLCDRNKLQVEYRNSSHVSIWDASWETSNDQLCTSLLAKVLNGTVRRVLVPGKKRTCTTVKVRSHNDILSSLAPFQCLAILKRGCLLPAILSSTTAATQSYKQDLERKVVASTHSNYPDNDSDEDTPRRFISPHHWHRVCQGSNLCVCQCHYSASFWR
jgi:hypothetical protein